MLMDLLAMMSPQNKRLFKLNTFAQPGDEELLLEYFSGAEALSKPFSPNTCSVTKRRSICPGYSRCHHSAPLI
jgi:type VI secretion system secreted protein VgrG